MPAGRLGPREMGGLESGLVAGLKGTSPAGGGGKGPGSHWGPGTRGMGRSEVLVLGAGTLL